MNEIVNTFLLAGENFMPKLHLRQPGLIYSVWGLSEERKKLYGPQKEKNFMVHRKKKTLWSIFYG